MIYLLVYQIQHKFIKKIIGNSVEMIISASGMILINCTNLNTTCNVGIGTHTTLHVNGKMTINTGNTQVAPPRLVAYGGIGDRIVFWNGSPTVIVWA